MPLLKTSDKWFVRVDGNKDFLLEKSKELVQALDTVKILGLYHVGSKGENPHLHFVIQIATVIQQQSFNIRIKKLFSIEKKSQFSIKVWDGEDGACSYMFHEHDECILASKGFNPEDIQKYRDLNKKVQEVVAINKQRGGGKLVDRVVAEFKDDRPTRKDIFDNLCEKIRDGEMYEPGDFQLKRYIEEIYLKTTGRYNFEDYCAERFHNLFLR